MMTMTATTSLEYAEKFFPWSIPWFPKTVDCLSPLATEWAKLNPNKVDRRRLALYLAVLRIYQDRWTEAEDALLQVFPEGGGGRGGRSGRDAATGRDRAAALASGGGADAQEEVAADSPCAVSGPAGSRPGLCR
jgi:hypothetical protein